MTSVDRLTRCIVGWAIVEERCFTTMQPVIDQVPPCLQFYSDGLNVYPTLLYKGKCLDSQHTVAPGKSQTYNVEGVNADLRHYLARLNRKSRCFPRCPEALRRAVWLFVLCYNKRRLWLFHNPSLKTAQTALADFLPALN